MTPVEGRFEIRRSHMARFSAPSTVGCGRGTRGGWRHRALGDTGRRDGRLPDRDKAPESVLHERAADGDNPLCDEDQGDQRAAERQRGTERAGRRHHPVLLRVRDHHLLWLSDADGHDRILSIRDHPAESLLQRPENPAGLGQRLEPDAVYELPLPSRREQSRRFGRMVPTRPSRRRSRRHSRTSKSPAKVKAGKKFKVQFQLKYNAKSVKIFIKKKNGAIVQTNNFGSLRAGQVQEDAAGADEEGELQG